MYTRTNLYLTAPESNTLSYGVHTEDQEAEREWTTIDIFPTSATFPQEREHWTSSDYEWWCIVWPVLSAPLPPHISTLPKRHHIIALSWTLSITWFSTHQFQGSIWARRLWRGTGNTCLHPNRIATMQKQTTDEEWVRSDEIMCDPCASWQPHPASVPRNSSVTGTNTEYQSIARTVWCVTLYCQVMCTLDMDTKYDKQQSTPLSLPFCIFSFCLEFPVWFCFASCLSSLTFWSFSFNWFFSWSGSFSFSGDLSSLSSFGVLIGEFSPLGSFFTSPVAGDAELWFELRSAPSRTFHDATEALLHMIHIYRSMSTCPLFWLFWRRRTYTSLHEKPRIPMNFRIERAVTSEESACMACMACMACYWKGRLFGYLTIAYRTYKRLEENMGRSPS